MFERFAIFYTPTGASFDLGSAWLGWDNATGAALPQPQIAGIDAAAVTATPRKYGFHGTLKAPFRLAAHTSPGALQQGVADFAARARAVGIGRLVLDHDSGFAALRPLGQHPALHDLARAIVTGLDSHRAPAGDADIARRRAAGLTERQDRQMLEWGYPYIFDDFHFHLTLSGHLADAAAAVTAALRPMFAPVIAAPCTIDAITLMGRDPQGMFHQIHRYALTG